VVAVTALARLEAVVAVDHARQTRTQSTAAADRLAVTLTEAQQHLGRLARVTAAVRRG
jgi:hypothetical protein